MFIYIIGNCNKALYKIGISKRPEQRLKQLQTGNHEELELIFTCHVVSGLIFMEEPKSRAKRIEALIHYKYRAFRRKGEWFRFNNPLVLDVIETIIRTCRFLPIPKNNETKEELLVTVKRRYKESTQLAQHLAQHHVQRHAPRLSQRLNLLLGEEEEAHLWIDTYKANNLPLEELPTDALHALEKDALELIQIYT